MTRKYIQNSLIALVLTSIFTVTPALANDIYIEQVGDTLDLAITQDGQNNVIGTSTTDGNLDGDSMTFAITQTGSTNSIIADIQGNTYTGAWVFTGDSNTVDLSCDSTSGTNCENITFDITPKYRKYYKYHSNMIELEHGDKGSLNKLPLTMAQEQPQMWANTKFRYGYLHHIHHTDKTTFKSSKDSIGVNITYLRSPSPADLWHSDNQFLNIIACEGFVHSKNFGRVSHITHYF